MVKRKDTSKYIIYSKISFKSIISKVYFLLKIDIKNKHIKSKILFS